MSTGTSPAATGDTAPPAPGRRRSLATRVSWGLADQAVSSLTNFAVGLVVARSLGAVDFGIFALAWATFGGALNISRGLASDPFVVRFNGTSTDVWRAALRRATGTAVLVGLAAGAVGVGVGALIGGPVGAAFVALGVVMPALLLQDAWRFGFFAAGRGHQAFANDTVWAVALVPGLAVAALNPSVVTFVLAWGGAAAVAALYGCFQARAVPRPLGCRSWLRDQRDLGARYVLENVSNSGAGQIRTYGLGAITGLVAIGSVRGAELLLGPFLAVLMGLSLVAVPEAARVARANPSRLPRFCLLLGGVQAVAALTWGLMLLFFLPDAIGTQLLGSVWPAASALLLPATLSVTFAGLSSGASTGLRALGAARRGLRAQLFTSAAYIVGGLTGAVVDGAVGSSWGVALGCLLGSGAWWVQLRNAHRAHDRTPTTTTEEKG
jgi:O-antigen/teichoic acid export membrane protein